MKFTAAIIILALLCMVVEGCAGRTDDGRTVGRKLDEATDRDMLALVATTDDPATRSDVGSAAAATVARSISDHAILSTLAVTDAAISSSIQTELIKDPGLKEAKIDVDARDGVVSLSGIAGDQERRARAGEIARINRGVVRVENNVEVIAAAK